MKKEVRVLKDKSGICVQSKKCLDSEQLSVLLSARYNPKRVIFNQNLNNIALSDKNFNLAKDKLLTLINTVNGKYVDVSTMCDSSLGCNEIATSGFVRESLNIQEDSQLILCSNKVLHYEKVMLQKIDNIKEDTLVISYKDIDGAVNSIHDSKYELLEVINTVTGKSIIISKSHIIVDTSLPDGAIRLNRKQRGFLDTDLPLHLSDIQYNRLKEALSADEEDINYLLSLYSEEDRILNNDLTYEQKQRARKILITYCNPSIYIKPVLESFNVKNKRKFFKRITDFFVGKSTMALACRRPYESDENSNIVRISPSNMKLLGIEEMDNVILQYKRKQVVCRALELENETAFAETNLPISIDLAIGVPVHVRKALGIPNVNSTIKVDRDTGFILKKSVNEQIVPIILTLFSAKLFSDSSVIISVLLALLAVPVVVYINLSSKRNMRA